MKVLIVNTNRERAPETVVPLGACAVATATEAAGHEVTFLDLTFHRDPLRALRKSLDTARPELVGLSLRNLDNGDYTHPRSYLPAARELVSTLRDYDVEVVLGGPAVGQNPEALLRCLGCRLAVCGEGEVAFPALLAALANGTDPAAVQGVTLLEQGEARNSPVAPMTELASLPPVEPERWLELSRYRAYEASWPLQTKRGCALRCTYCVYPLLEGRQWRLQEPERVAEEAERGRRLGFRLGEIVDSFWGLPSEHALACCEALARGPRLPLSTMELSPGAISPELIEAMNAAGFTAVGISAESASDQMLRALGKDYTTEQLWQAERESQNLRAQRMWIFLLGAPGEEEATLRETGRFIAALPQRDLVFLTWGVRLFSGTALTEALIQSGEVEETEELLWPRFYWTPRVTLERARQIIADCGFPLQNQVTLSEGMHRLLPLVQRLAALCRVKPPYWRHGAKLQRLRRALRL